MVLCLPVGATLTAATASGSYALGHGYCGFAVGFEWEDVVLVMSHLRM